MKTLTRFAWSIAAAAVLLSGCGQAERSNVMPSGAGLTQLERTTSWMLPTLKAQDLIYVVPEYASAVSVYAYPGGELVGSLANTNENPIGDCVDKSGDVFIVNLDTPQLGPGDVVEYRHGGTIPIETLTPGEQPTGCAVDATTGDLAVTRNGSVYVYPRAKGPPRNYYSLSLSGIYYCSYDDKGNLFVDGINTYSHNYQLAELPADQKHFTLLTMDKRPRIPFILGGVQWDGKRVVIGPSERYDAAYRLAVFHQRARILDSTTLEYGEGVGSTQFWIQGNTIVAPSVRIGSSKNNEFGLWTYPQGRLIKFVPDSDGPWAVTVSLAPH